MTSQIGWYLMRDLLRDLVIVAISNPILPLWWVPVISILQVASRNHPWTLFAFGCGRDEACSATGFHRKQTVAAMEKRCGSRFARYLDSTLTYATFDVYDETVTQREQNSQTHKFSSSWTWRMTDQTHPSTRNKRPRMDKNLVPEAHADGNYIQRSAIHVLPSRPAHISGPAALPFLI